VFAFGFVEPQGGRDAVEDGVGGAGEVPAFHPDVVVDADAGEQGDLLAAQALHAPAAATVGGQPGLGRDPRAGPPGSP
jgi:hypothetical protein